MAISPNIGRRLVPWAFAVALAIPGSASGQTTSVNGMTGNADAGKALYKRFCVGCHGAEGTGDGENAVWLDPRPRDFVTALFRWRSTPTGTLPTNEDLYDTITRGVVDTYMPTWRSLTPQDRVDLLAYIKTFSPRWKTQGPGTPITIPPEPPESLESVLHGRQLFDQMQCWKCHGPEGRGDGASAPTLTDDKGLPIKPYNFHDGTRFRCGETNQDLYKIFMTGLDGTPMPSFADILKPNDAWDLVHFLRTLQPLVKSKSRAEWEGYVKAHPNEIKPMGEAAGGGE
ncbi:MAG TPA: cytochrome c [Candidatus Sulfotelmatobacter sp.]|nr:cytochrome c [Candidatus Sulfotelmatobacter sp.]